MPNAGSQNDGKEPTLLQDWFRELIETYRKAFGGQQWGVNLPAPDAPPAAKFQNKRYTPPKSLAPAMPGYGPLVTRESIAVDIAKSGMQSVADELVDLWKKGDTLGAQRIKVLEEELAAQKEENRRYYEENKELMKVIEKVRGENHVRRGEYHDLVGRFNALVEWRKKHMELFHRDDSRMNKQGVELSGTRANGKQPRTKARVRRG